jgi:hypothetical protein
MVFLRFPFIYGYARGLESIALVKAAARGPEKP